MPGRMRAALIVLALLPLGGCSAVVVGQGSPAPAFSTPVPVSPTSASPSASPGEHEAADLLMHVRNAFSGVPAMEVHGGLVSHGQAVTLDAAVGYGAAAGSPEVGEATVTTRGLAVSEREIGIAYWMKAPPAYWVALTSMPADTAAGLQDMWVASPPGLDSATALTSVFGLSELLLPASDAQVTLDGTREVDGRTLQVVRDENGTSYLIVPGDQPQLIAITTSTSRLDFTYPAAGPAVVAPGPGETVAMPA